MTIDIIKLKALATAAAANQYDAVALNDYGTAVRPATVLGLIAEIERHRQINAEGCKPDSNILLSGQSCAAATSCRSLDTAEGCKPDLNIVPAQTTVPDLLTPEQAAQLLGLSVKTLATWRSTGKHALPFTRCGARIRYQRSELVAWLAGRGVR
ncbi:helix-turn-helix domain-containing protein [Pseudomonas sp. NMI1173_11]|uniref:helix-turn-helix domain-containing protein n=1 Tax=Pseudomonas sp. NMI1173_11 TaxID=2903145 RepID=UPI001E45CABA|nr:helix-turn-helix domain-containing protein [Pseudomonas sp. NMI1173_11]MCE1004477.1 helix-turn-helix domain-containing protein [Pseudomonas sp. NMI1173_11]